jgi:uncharacterized protein DUF6080
VRSARSWSVPSHFFHTLLEYVVATGRQTEMGQIDALPAEPPVRRRESGAVAHGREPFWFALAFVVLYAAVATLLFRHAPSLFLDLDEAFDADLGSWTIDLARPQGPHIRTRIHPLAILLLNPFGSAIRAVLRAASVPFAARLAAQWLCAIAGALAVALFRVLLARTGVRTARARLWTLLFATSATQVVFSTLPESYAFSALSLVTVFAVAAGPRPSWWARLAAGVFAFGITVTNLVAVAVVRVSGLDWRRAWRSLLTCAAHVGGVVLATVGLSLVQRAVYPTAPLFFVRGSAGSWYASYLFVPDTALEAVRRFAAVASNVVFAGLCAPEVQVVGRGEPHAGVRFKEIAVLTPTPLSAVHWLLWAFVLLQALRGSLPGRPRGAAPGDGGARGLIAALWLWLGFVVALHYAFGTCLFLYSGHWVFALVAVAAFGIEARPDAAGGRVSLLLVVLVILQVAAHARLILQMLQVFSGS